MPSLGGPPIVGQPPVHGPGQPGPPHTARPVIRSPGRTGRNALPTPFIVPYPVFVGSQGYTGALEAGSGNDDTPPDVPAMAPMSIPPPPPPQMPAPEKTCGPAPAPRPAPEDDRVLYLIPLKDGWVYTAIAYWISTGTVHYITLEGIHNQVSLQLMDREAFAKLNARRSVEFALTPKRN